MEMIGYFSDFLRNIQLPSDVRAQCEESHKKLRKNLNEDETFGKIIVSDFLQGSYRRGTIVKPVSQDEQADVDVVIATKLSKDEYTPHRAFDLFRPFLEKHYSGSYRIQGRSIGISLPKVNLDLVITSDPDEAVIGILKEAFVTNSNSPEDFQNEMLRKSWTEDGFLQKALKSFKWSDGLLYIPDREAQQWVPTNPLAQIRWTWQKNLHCNGHFTGVVKSIKWWKNINPGLPKYPKGYPLERIIAECCPDSIGSVAEGLVKSFENISRTFEKNIMANTVPVLGDHGLPANNVLARIDAKDFSSFFYQVQAASVIARKAFDSEDASESITLWRRILGDTFPEFKPPKDGYTTRQDITKPSGGRYA